MKRLKMTAFAMIALLTAFVAVPNSVIAETFKKLHPSPNRVLYCPANSGSQFNYTAYQVGRGTSTTVDLSGGDLDKLSFGVYADSSTLAGSGQLQVRLDISPDGGTTWLTNYSIQLTTAGLTAINTYYTNIAVNPGTKARLVNTFTPLSASATFYGLTEWVVGNTD